MLRFIAALFLPLLASACVVGTVRDASTNAPLPGAQVIVVDASGKSANASANERGGYVLKGPFVAGVATLKAKADGYPIVTRTTEIAGGATLTVQDLALTRSTCPPGLGARQLVSGDIDGDGQPETLYIRRSPATDVLLLGACLPGGRQEIKVGGQATAIYGTVDSNGDGSDEVFFGDTTALSLIVEIAKLVDGHLTKVTLPQGQPLEFEVTPIPSPTGAPDGRGMGCVDVNHDGRPEVVALSYLRSGDVVRWTRTPFAIDGSTARQLAIETGTFTSPGDDAKIALLHQATCGDQQLAAF
jgi:hypothetical protein